MNTIFENVTIADGVAVLMYLSDEVDLFVTYISRWIQKFELVADQESLTNMRQQLRQLVASVEDKYM